MIKVIIFDLGGVIINSFGKELLRDASQVLNIPQKKLRILMDKYKPDLQIGKINHIQFWRLILKEKGRRMPDFVLKPLWMRSYLKKATIKSEMLDFVKQLKKRYRVGLISNCQEPHNAYNRKRGLLQLFDPCYLSNEVGLRKSDTRIFQKFLEEVKCLPGKAVFVDDEGRNLKPAQELGIHTILFSDLKTLRKSLASYGVIVD